MTTHVYHTHKPSEADRPLPEFSEVYKGFTLKREPVYHLLYIEDEDHILPAALSSKFSKLSICHSAIDKAILENPELEPIPEPSRDHHITLHNKQFDFSQANQPT